MVRISRITSVALLRPVDMTIADMAFPRANGVWTTQKVEFDFYLASGKMANKGNFGDAAQVVEKGAYSTISCNPIQISLKTPHQVVDLSKKEFGKTVYGIDVSGMTQAQVAGIVSDMEGYMNAKKTALRRIKYEVYQALQSGVINVAGDNQAVDNVNFSMDEIIVNDNSTVGQLQWGNANADPIAQLEAQAILQGPYGVNTFVLGTEALKAFNLKRRIIDNATTGLPANFIPASAAEASAVEMASGGMVIFVGTTMGLGGKRVRIYAELDTYTDANGVEQPYLNKNYCVGFAANSMDNGSMEYGAIPVAEDGMLKPELLPVEEYSGMDVEKDPAQTVEYYKTSPMPVMKRPNGFVSIKATLVA